MDRLKYKVELFTPAFLGNADQHSQWRVPPLKALIRQWWRIVVAKSKEYDWKRIRELEGHLFGHAWLNHQIGAHRSKKWFFKSQVTISLVSWEDGNQLKWEGESLVFHPEVEKKIGAHLYLGYGPLQFSHGSTVVNTPPFLKAGASNVLLVRLPEKIRIGDEALKVKGHLTAALKLVHAFGTVGGRSRNGWGSLGCWEIDEKGNPQAKASEATLQVVDKLLRQAASSFSRSWRECLGLDWPHAIGADEKGPLLWRSRQTFKSWADAMREIATVKIEFRTKLAPFSHNKDGEKKVIHKRHVFGYPVTNHGVSDWNRERLANQLRFKVHRVGESYVVFAVHVPHRVPEPLVKKLSDPMQQRQIREWEGELWSEVHRYFDSHQRFQRL